MSESPLSPEKLEPGETRVDLSSDNKKNNKVTLSLIWERIVRMGLGETALRVGTAVVSFVLILIVVWVMNNFYMGGINFTAEQVAQAAALTEEVTLDVAQPEYVGQVIPISLTRLADLHTIVPSRPRFDVIQYEVQSGDTIFGIAEMFGLRPSTILWGNYNTLYDNVENLYPGQLLNILPVDGTYYEWNAGDGLNGVAEYFGVTTDTIIDWPGNYLNREDLGDLSDPNIIPGTWLIVPGGEREFITWTAPRITRDDPASSSLYGTGSCGTIADGAVGNGTFVWPTVAHYISGYVYSPETNHYGVDFGGQLGSSIYAMDNGVIVYAGWNDWGYGNVVVIDHGDWQTLYAHLDSWNVSCGQSVYQGDVIGYMGSTGNSSGPHLHLEMLSDTYGRVDPIQFLP
ncbi:MAG TPA: M23 family metallopeptidase [Longilinea sp.]|nr:M23 family metallopeptidase [Longilinea sp.]